MPYETRRKSISLSALGITVPQTSRVHRPSISKTSSDPEHPKKRLKRDQSGSFSESIPSATSPITKTVTFADRPTSREQAAYEHTPPPSPGFRESQIDYDNINDDIVAGVLQQLKSTGNLPHLIKDLANVLSTTNADVSRSANAAALLSSRLASFMRRPWSAANPCPIAKDLINVHPRKVFYYLTSIPMRPLPPSALQPLLPPSIRGKQSSTRIITPSLSNASQDDEISNSEERKRAALSPSPEIELGINFEELIQSPVDAVEFPTPPINGPTQFISSTVKRRQSEDSISESRRGKSPPLELDEREFENAARLMEAKRMDTNEEVVAVKIDKIIGSIESDDTAMEYNQDAARLSLGNAVTPMARASSLLSSPVVKASNFTRPVSRMNDLDIVMLDIRRPQSIGFDELDDLLDQC